MWRFTAVYTVTNENMATMWNTSHHTSAMDRVEECSHTLEE